MPKRKGAVTVPVWAETQWQTFERDNWKCVHCRRRGPMQAHHILPRSKGGGDEMGNLASLCPACHVLMDGGGWKVHAPNLLHRIHQNQQVRGMVFPLRGVEKLTKVR